MHKLILVFVYQLSELSVRSEILRRKGRTVERDNIVFITIWYILWFIRFKIITGANVYIVSVILEPLHIRQMELQNMLFCYRCYK